MTPELYFIYDSHCPWSYATTTLVNKLAEAFPEMSINAWHCAYYNGNDSAGFKQVDSVMRQSSVKFGQEHMRFVDSPKNSTMSANLMAWLQNKQPEKLLPVLNALQETHFIDGDPLTCKHDFGAIIEQFKLSPPNKVFKDELSNDAEYILSDIGELQDFMGTTGFPALLLTHDDKAILLDHSLYLNKPASIIKAVEKELK